MNRLDAIRLTGGSLVPFGPGPTRPLEAVALTLPQLAFAVFIGPDRGIGVLFEEPVLVVQDLKGSVKRVLIPQAKLDGEQRWLPMMEPREPSSIFVNTAPSSDVLYGRIPDHVTALCRGSRGVYIAMIAFNYPYIVHYDPEEGAFQTRPLLPSRVMVMFERPGRLYYVTAGTTELRSIESVASASTG